LTHVVGVAQQRDLDDIAGSRRMNEIVISDVDPDMLEIAEEHKIAGLQRESINPRTKLVLRSRIVR
jgi:hypothetical protein